MAVHGAMGKRHGVRGAGGRPKTTPTPSKRKSSLPRLRVNRKARIINAPYGIMNVKIVELCETRSWVVQLDDQKRRPFKVNNVKLQRGMLTIAEFNKSALRSRSTSAVSEPQKKRERRGGIRRACASYHIAALARRRRWRSGASAAIEVLPLLRQPRVAVVWPPPCSLCFVLCVALRARDCSAADAK